DVELTARTLVDLRRPARELLFEPLRLRSERRPIDVDACPLHGNQHGNQRTLERLVHAAQLLLRQQTPEDGSELPREIGALRGVIEGCFGRYVGERDRLRAAATYVFFHECLVARVLEGKILEPVFRSAGIDQIAREHRVDVESTQRNVVPG